MIDRLRRRMILISSLAIFAVLCIILAAIAIFSTRQLNTRLDIIADMISDNQGVFRPFDQRNPMPTGPDIMPGFFTNETPFSTRFFSVWYDVDGSYLRTELTAVTSITEDAAKDYAQAVLNKDQTRGWIDQFRYKIFKAEEGTGIVFVDGSMNRAMAKGLIFTVSLVMLAGFTAIFLLIVLASKAAVSPIARSYEKQKQFITDANHELKTPLTLILTNTDIVEQEKGHSEWLDDIRVEGRHMSELIGQLTALSRLDETSIPLCREEFSLSDVCNDTIAEFSSLAVQKALRLTANVQPDVSLTGDEASVRRLVSILLDNAVKYCDPAGTIYFSMEKKRHTILMIENSYAEVESVELDRLFDRFYRGDKARTAGSGFGIGLSLAASIAETHKGSIRAYQSGPGRIGFCVTLK